MEPFGRCVFGINVRLRRLDGSTSQLLYAKVVATSLEQAKDMLARHPRYQELEFLTKQSLELNADVGYQPAALDAEPILVFERPRKRVRRCVLQLVAQDRPEQKPEPQRHDVLGNAEFHQHWDGGMTVKVSDPRLLMKVGDWVLLNMDGSPRLVRGHVTHTNVEMDNRPIHDMQGRIAGFTQGQPSREYTILVDEHAPITGHVDHVLTFPTVLPRPTLQAGSAVALRTQEGIWDRQAQKNEAMDLMAREFGGMGSKGGKRE